MKRLLIAAALLLGAAAVAGVARPEGSHAAGPTDPLQRTITVTGNGTATSTPTRASLSFGVQTQAQTAKVALAQNAAAMIKVIAALEGAGAKDVATATVSLSPAIGENQRLQGYIAANTVTATVTYAAAGATIDAAVDAGANQVYGPSPLAEDADALYEKALAAAVANARAHAGVLATAAGAKVGAVTTVTESGSAPVAVFEKAAPAAADSTPIVAGPQDTTASVVVTFELS